MRSKNSLLNIITTISMQILSLVLGFVARRVFVENLPISLLGISATFDSFFYAVGLIDIGFAAILVYNLYKPINEKDEESIKWYVSIFKKIYSIIAFIIFTISMCIMPFIFKIFNMSYSNHLVIYLIYIIQLFTVLIKYFFIHKNNLIVINQQKWKINLINMLLDISVFILKSISIIVFKSYVLYLLSILLNVFTLNYINVYLANKMYPFIKKLPKVTLKEIKNSGIIKQSQNFIYHTFYNFVYYSTDNFIISYKLGVEALGFISNYTMIIKIFDDFLSSIITSLRDSFANYLHTEKDVDGLLEIYKMTNVFNYFLVSISIVGLYSMIDKWIPLWLGDKFLIERNVTIFLILNLAIDLMFRPLENIYTIKGYVFKERLPIFISAILNIILSLILVEYMGLAGVFLGTFIGKVVFWYGKLYHVTNDVFKNEKFTTILDLFKYIILLLIEVLLINYCLDIIYPIVSSLLVFFIRGICCVILTIIFNCVIFYNSIYFKKLLNMLKSTILNFRKGVSNV